MTNFKSGSGNLDFGDDEGADDERTDHPPEATADSTTDESVSTADTVDDGTDTQGSGGATVGETYPYFVRRNNVGDERDTRLEIHVRDKVADREGAFRHALADHLDASDVSKTDAREFALLAAFEHPEQVAQLMREEGFDTLG